MQAKDANQRCRVFAFLERYEFLITLYRQFHPARDPLDAETLTVQLQSKEISVQDAITALETHSSALESAVDLKDVMSEFTKASGYYGWHLLRYFMFEYEQHLKSLSKAKRAKLTWEEFSRESYEDDYSTVEHIFPQNAVDPSWKAEFKAYTSRQRNTLRNSMGNLIPLSKPKNSALRNVSFQEKRSTPDKTIGYAYGCYSENEVAQENKWGAREILLRGVKLLTFMESRWQVSFGSATAKVKILGLEFVLSKEPDLSLVLHKRR